MARTHPISNPEQQRRLDPASSHCTQCGKSMRIAYQNKRHLLTLQGRIALIVEPGR